MITVSLKWNISNIATMIVKSHIYYPPLLCAGETIELLDIGLRHSKDHNAVHRVKPSASRKPPIISIKEKVLFILACDLGGVNTQFQLLNIC